MMTQLSEGKCEFVGWGPLVLVLALLLAAPPGVAQDDAGVSRLRGERLAAQGNCEEALPQLAIARAADPTDARAALVSGQCQISLRRYVEAVASLEEAKRLAPDSAEADLFLGMALFHQGNLEESQKALEAAEQRLPDRAEVHLYLGLLALQRGEAAEAAIALSRSGQADPDAVEPIASYYAALAFEIEGERQAAAEALRRAQVLAAGTVWETQVIAALERLGEEGQPSWKWNSPRPLEVLRERSPGWWINITGGFEYDDNVVLRGSGVQLPQEISSRRDVRGVWWVEAGYELFANQDWTVGAMATYFGSAHEDLHDFNANFPGFSLWVDRRLRPGTIGRVQYDFGYSWIGGDPFLMTNTVTPAVYQNWGSAGTTRLSARFQTRSYFFDTFDVPDGPGRPGAFCRSGRHVVCGPRGLNEERERKRDGWGFALGLDHSWPVWGEKLVLRAGYRYRRYTAWGSEWTLQTHEGQLGMRLLLPFQFAFEAFGSYAWVPFRNPSTYPDPGDVFYQREYPLSDTDRTDDFARVDLVLERPVNKYLMLSLRYAYFDNISNVNVFDYDRQILGMYATLRFSP